MKALRLNDFESAATLIKLGANVCLAGSDNASPISVIFGRNILALKRVVKEYFSAKKYKEFEVKYKNTKQVFIKATSNRLDNRSQNSFLGSIHETVLPKTHSKFSKHQEPNNYIDQQLSKKTSGEHSKQLLSNLKHRTPSEEVLTDNTNHDKGNIVAPNEQPFVGTELELNNQMVGKQSPKHTLPVYRKKIAMYSEQIEEVKAKIETIKQAS